MLAFKITLSTLLALGLACSIAELGLTAYVTTIWGRSRQIPYWDPYQGFVYKSFHVDTPGIVSFLLFAAAWSVVASMAAILLSLFYTSKGAVSPTVNSVLGVTFSFVFLATSVFWIAGFANMESILGGGTSYNRYLNAVIALAVVLWVLFLALFVLTLMALGGVVASDWAGYQSMRRPKTVDAPVSAPAPVPRETREIDESVYDRRGSLAPTAPSELSTRDAEAMHTQPVSRAHSTSARSAVASVGVSSEATARYERAVSHD